MKFKVLRNLSAAAMLLYLLYKYQPKLPTAKNNKSLLWEVSGNGVKDASYLFGTMHLMCAEDAIISRYVRKVINRISVMYLEVDINEAGELLGGEINFNIKDEGTLSDHLSEEEYLAVKSFFEINQPGLPFSLLEKQHPLMLSSGLYELFLPCEIKNGIEVKLVAEAVKAKKQIRGLETLAFQAEIFNSIPYDQQAKDLYKTISNIDHFKQMMADMLEVYKSQDLDKLYDLTMQDESGVSGHLDVLLYNRNHNWVQQVEEIMHHQPALFAVGAGHLGGPQGLLNLLKQKGYSVRPLENAT